MTDVKPSLLQRLEDAIHSFADHHKPLITETLQRLRELEQNAAQLEKNWEARLTKLEAEVAALVKKDGPAATQIAHDAAAVVADAEKATGA